MKGGSEKWRGRGCEAARGTGICVLTVVRRSHLEDVHADILIKVRHGRHELRRPLELRGVIEDRQRGERVDECQGDAGVGRVLGVGVVPQGA